MASIGTYCGDCCFYNNLEKTCKQNILDIFKNDGSEILWNESGPSVDRVCQYKRLDEWADKNELKTIDEKIQLCKNEIYLRGTIVLLAEDIDSLRTTVDKLATVENIKNFKILIIYRNIKYVDILTTCGSNLKSEYKIINNINNDKPYQIYKALEFAKNGYLFIIDCQKEFDEKCIDKINYAVNIKMLRLLHVIGTDDMHQSVSMLHLYKWLKGDLECNFADKLKDIAQQEDSNAQTLTWKEIDEQYSC